MTNVAGMENHLLELLPGLCSRGLDVTLLILVEPAKAAEPITAYAAQLRNLGVQVELIEMPRDLDIRLIGQLARKFREAGYDAVHTHLIHADLHGVIAARRAGIRYVFCTAHNDDKFRHLLPIRLFQAWLWQRINAGIAISEALRQFLLKVEFAPPKRIHTVPYGFDPAKVAVNPEVRAELRDSLGLSSHTFIAGSVCRLTEQKGVQYALEAFRQVVDQHPDAHYVIIGDGPLRADLQARSIALGVQDHVHFLGWRSDARSLFAAFDVLLMPSLWEGFGLVALEAMAAYIPVIASCAGALAEIVADRQTGSIVPAANPGRLAAAIINLLDNPAQAQAMGQNGRRRLEAQFSVDRMIDSTLQVYRSA